MKKTLQRGFTLIELLVVIAIIGILAAVVLASLNDARSSGTDAAIKQSLGNIRSQAEIVYNQAGFTYAAVCTNAKVLQLYDAARASAGNATSIAEGTAMTVPATHATCRDSATSWLVTVPMVGTGTAGDQWCVDSAGRSGLVSNANFGFVSAANDLGCITGTQS